jgi:hypothetical protein
VVIDAGRADLSDAVAQHGSKDEQWPTVRAPHEVVHLDQVAAFLGHRFNLTAVLVHVIATANRHGCQPLRPFRLEARRTERLRGGRFGGAHLRAARPALQVVDSELVELMDGRLALIVSNDRASSRDLHAHMITRPIRANEH